jgi:hypothetical protein
MASPQPLDRIDQASDLKKLFEAWPARYSRVRLSISDWTLLVVGTLSIGLIAVGRETAPRVALLILSGLLYLCVLWSISIRKARIQSIRSARLEGDRLVLPSPSFLLDRDRNDWYVKYFFNESSVRVAEMAPVGIMDRMGLVVPAAALGSDRTPNAEELLLVVENTTELGPVKRIAMPLAAARICEILGALGASPR